MLVISYAGEGRALRRLGPGNSMAILYISHDLRLFVLSFLLLHSFKQSDLSYRTRSCVLYHEAFDLWLLSLCLRGACPILQAHFQCGNHLLWLG